MDFVRKWHPAGKKLECDHTDSPYIDLSIVGLTFAYLRGHILIRTTLAGELSIRGVKLSGQAKVGKFYAKIISFAGAQNVVLLHISMDDIFGVQAAQCLEKLSDRASACSLTQWLFPLAKVATCDELLHQVEVALVFHHIGRRGDVWVDWKFGDEVELSATSFNHFLTSFQTLSNNFNSLGLLHV